MLELDLFYQVNVSNDKRIKAAFGQKCSGYLALSDIWRLYAGK